MTELKTPEPIEELFERLRVEAVFGPSIQEGDVTIIPVADVGIGFGFGSAPSPVMDEERTETDEMDADADNGKGEGAAGGGKATPRGYLIISSEGVVFESIIDENRVALARIALSAWRIFWVAKTLRAFARK
jgi:uncharacterized spore protein YtfJ